MAKNEFGEEEMRRNRTRRFLETNRKSAQATSETLRKTKSVSINRAINRKPC